MSVTKAKEFFKRLEDDVVFREAFLKDETLIKGNPDTIFKSAAKHGYEFSKADLDEVKKELKSIELSDEQLEKINGGFGFGLCVLAGLGVFENWDDSWSLRFGDTGEICVLIGFK